MRINNNHNNLAFDREINNSKFWLQARMFDTCGYPSDVLLDRLTQRLVEISLYPYSLAVSTLCKTTGNCFPVSGTRINCGHAFLETGSGKITLTLKQLLANQFEFFIHWAFCLLAMLSVTRGGGNDSPAVLVFGVGDSNLFAGGHDRQFAEYCRGGAIEPLRNGRRLIIQSALKKAASVQPGFSYARNPLIQLLREARMGFWGRLRLVGKHLLLLLSYTFATIRFPQLSLLGRDIAYSSVAFELDRHGLIQAIVLTISNYFSQPLWVRELRNAKVHMIWYAQNFKPVVYASDRLESDIPNLRWIRVDTHWVWTNAFADYLKGLGHNNTIKVVGPLVWQLPEISAPAKDVVEIVIFDISPYSDEVALGGGEITNYNRPDNLFSFIQDIISLKPKLEETFHLPVSFKLKTKRGYNAVYDRRYFDYLEQLASLGSISLEHHSMNIYSLISRSHLVLVYPYSSPAYIAEYLKVPSIYYDPTNSIVGQNFGDTPSLISFANSPEDLLDAAISALSKVFPHNA